MTGRTPQRLRFCLDLSHHPWTRGTAERAVDATLRAIRIADQAGLDSVWVSEDPDGWDAYAVLGAAARQTSRIRLGTGVTNPYLRHPNLIAMSVATLDHLSAGRAFVGLGRGQPEWYRGLGVPVGRPLTVLDESVDLVRAWLHPPYQASSSSHFPVRDWAHAFGAVQSHVPIYLAALGPRAVALAARKADGILIPDFASEQFLSRFIPDVQQQLVEVGRDPDAFRFFARTGIVVTDAPEPVLERRKTLMALLCTLPGMSRHIEVPGFDVEQILSDVRRVMRTDEVLERGGGFIELRREADLDAARRLIPTELVDAVSYVGTAEEVRERLGRLVHLGVTHVFASHPGNLDVVEYGAQIAEITPA